MIACFIRYDLDPYKLPEFDEYARNWGQVIPHCGANLVGYFASARRIGDNGLWRLHD